MSNIKSELQSLIKDLPINDVSKKMLETRWLFYVDKQNYFANQARLTYYVLQTINLIGGFMIPIVVNVSDANFAPYKNWTITILGILVSISAGVIQIYQMDRRWRHHRKYAELARIEGFKYFAFSDDYNQFKTKGGHEEGLSFFFSNIEKITKSEVEIYIDEVTSTKGQTLFDGKVSNS